jgi:hypothetical protein
MYLVLWKSAEENSESEFVETIRQLWFDDIQWKDYGVRATKDRTETEERLTMVIPYTSIYDITVLSEDEDS